MDVGHYLFDHSFEWDVAVIARRSADDMARRKKTALEVTLSFLSSVGATDISYGETDRPDTRPVGILWVKADLGVRDQGDIDAARAMFEEMCRDLQL